MPKYQKKIQVLLTEEQFRDLEEIAAQQKKKLGALVREAIEEYHLKQANQRRISNAVDRLLSLPEQPVPENYQAWEAEYKKTKYSCQ